MPLNEIGDFIAKCGKLKSGWSTRNRKIKEWYNLLRLEDELKQDGMESVASNDPRTGYNLGKHLMTSSIVAHKVDTEELLPEEIAATSYLESYINKRWQAEEVRYRRTGRQGFRSQVVGLMLATGWRSVFAMVDERQLYAEVWNPYQVFPEFSPDGLIEVANIYSLKPAAANYKAKLMEWELKFPVTQTTFLYNYWGFDDDGDVVNGIALGKNWVKTIRKEPALSKLGILPVFISPVGGLPDEGIIDTKYQEHLGESIVATNEELTKNYNRMLTFSQQLMRDTAQARWLEKTTGEIPVLTEENINKRGAIYKIAPGEEIGPVPVSPMPIELRTMLFDYQNMLQRGLFPWAIFGNIQQQMSYLAMANIASAALQVLTPYMDDFKGLMSDINNFWYKMIKANNYHPYGFKMPDNMPKEFEFDVQADIEIPGYLIQRATVARMLDPTFRLSTQTVMDKMFPEIRDSLKEQAKVRKDDAMMHPKAIMVDQIIAYKEQARILMEAENKEAAALYTKLAESLEAELSMAAQPQPGTEPNPEQETMLREAFPAAEATAPIEGLGRI